MKIPWHDTLSKAALPASVSFLRDSIKANGKKRTVANCERANSPFLFRRRRHSHKLNPAAHVINEMRIAEEGELSATNESRVTSESESKKTA